MSDLLVRLYDLPNNDTRLPEGIVVRRALAPERRVVIGWVERAFHSGWASECELAFSSSSGCNRDCNEGRSGHRVCLLRRHRQGVLRPDRRGGGERGQGIGEALLMATLHGMREAGYAYAIIGWAGPFDFYRRRTNAIEIPDSTPGADRGLLPRE